MTPTPTLDAQRTDQLRSFLTVEAAADAARRQPVLTPARRRVAVGTAAALLLAGGLVAVQSVGGPAPAAIAVEVAGEWTTVRLVDIDADPDAVVAQLRDAGFTAERQTLDVVRTEDGDGFSVSVEDSADSAGIIAMAVGGEGGEHGVVGLTVALPEGTELAPPPEGADVPGAQAGGSPTGEPTSRPPRRTGRWPTTASSPRASGSRPTAGSRSGPAPT